jgi:isoleucyl-tRNA synthetase
VRRLAELGRSARAAASVRTRQPLSRALVGAPGFAALPAELRDLIADELNVRAVESLEAAGGELVRYTVKPDFRSLGRRFGPSTQAVAAVIRGADPAALAHALAAADGSVTVEVPEVGPVALSSADLIVTQTPLEGWGVAAAGGETVALDLTVTETLRAEGYAREVVRLIQEARKSSGLAVSDRIAVRWSARDTVLAAALEAYAPLIAGEVLATSFGPATRPEGDGESAPEADGESAPEADAESAPPADTHPGGEADAGGPWHEHGDDGLGLRFWLAVV